MEFPADGRDLVPGGVVAVDEDCVVWQRVVIGDYVVEVGVVFAAGEGVFVDCPTLSSVLA